MSSPSKEALPLRHPVRVETITLRPMTFELSATQPDFAEIARHLGVASLEALKATCSLSRNGDRVKLEGKITAALHQICVVTLEAFPVALTVPLKLDFAPEAELAAAAAADAGEGEIDIEVLLNEQDPPEPIIDGVIDLGAITLEFLALALDPYPRKPGANFDDVAPEAAPESPFAALARLKSTE
ncbi:YceD family protein [Bosea sp. (in: a-proteobacteria)]|uniref:YceD family protein n=1 Tax=Bosea sp. (in: a-proteobacteria) TaxID=1871050 RepID=UPI002FCB6D76